MNAISDLSMNYVRSQTGSNVFPYSYAIMSKPLSLRGRLHFPLPCSELPSTGLLAAHVSDTEYVTAGSAQINALKNSMCFHFDSAQL